MLPFLFPPCIADKPPRERFPCLSQGSSNFRLGTSTYIRAHTKEPSMTLHLPIPLITIILLIGSNIFMTYAWYGHLRHHSLTFIGAILVSWGIAFFEYCLQVPANRVGYGYFSAAELKTIQEVISLTIFGIFSTVYLGESLTWNHAIGFALIVAGAFFVFKA